MKNNNTRTIRRVCVTGVCVAAAALVCSTLIWFRMAGGYAPDESGMRSLRALILWGGLLTTLIALLGMAALLGCLIGFSRSTDKLTALLRPLEEKKFRALGGLPETTAPWKELRDSLVSLGTFFETLEDFIAENGAIAERVRAERIEEDAIISQAGETAKTILERFYKIEDALGEAAAAMEAIGMYLGSLRAAGEEQSRTVENIEGALSEAVTVGVSVADRLRENSGGAKALEEKIAAGEEQAAEVYGIIKNIAGDVEKIAGFAGAVNQIAEQTNILSMNAAIESAHAGAAGAGFAVVSEEIKKLAESAGENARGIQEELKNIAQKTAEALDAGKLSSLNFSAISGEAKQFTGAFAEITEAALKSRALGETAGTSPGRAEQNRNAGADIVGDHQRFDTALESIRALSGAARTEIRELHSGSREILEKIRTTQDKFLENSKKTGKLRALLPGLFPAASGEPPARAPAESYTPRVSGEDEEKKGFAARGHIETVSLPEPRGTDPDKTSAPLPQTAGPDFDSRGVAVKQAPHILS
jgi:methyl-accepting chemotaxis protein